jgi:hypothetical protein
MVLRESAPAQGTLAYGDPEGLMRELMLCRGLLYKAGLSVDGDPGK